MAEDLAGARRDYDRADLSEEAAGRDPVALFGDWYDTAAATPEVIEPNAMTLATVGPDGLPAARTVLLKGLDQDGFVFFTGTDSAKGRDLAAHPYAALTFTWLALQRQVRVVGRATALPRDQVEAYFGSRPRESRLGAWASVAAGGQSAPVASREVLDLAYAEVGSRFAEGEVPCPPSWGGYLVRPASIEFWQGRTGRLHDRLLFVRDPEGWTRQRLAP